MSHSTWEESKDRALTIWDTDWDYFSTANYVIIILSFSPYCILKVLIVTPESNWMTDEEPTISYQAWYMVYCYIG